MVCKSCGKKFYIKKTLYDLFSKKYEYLCDKCYMKYPIDLKLTSIILDKYHCHILSVFQRKYPINYNYYINEYSKIVETSLQKSGYILLFFDYIYLNDYMVELLDFYSKLFKKNLYIITFNLQN